MSNQELETFIQQMDQNFTTPPTTTSSTTLGRAAVIGASIHTYSETVTAEAIRRMLEEVSRVSDNSSREYVMYTGYEGYQNMMTVMRTTTTTVTGGPVFSPTSSQLSYKNYTVSENLTKNKNQIEYVLTTKSGVKISKVINNNIIEKERLNLSKGRVLGYKKYDG